LKRGAIVVAAERGAFSGKPRPWLVIQNDQFLDTGATVTVCMISADSDPAYFRIVVAPSRGNGLLEPSTVLADKILTLRARSIDSVVGQLEAGALARVDDALRLWLDV
jgi:mRNA interferase MazF